MREWEVKDAQPLDNGWNGLGILVLFYHFLVEKHGTKAGDGIIREVEDVVRIDGWDLVVVANKSKGLYNNRVTLLSRNKMIFSADEKATGLAFVPSEYFFWYIFKGDCF